ncbi:MAG: CinA family protein [Culturomica sp.]|jgi:nicotinamide-nucleotide amidase|nr:CinA family protein [Culturomica sp.]
MPKNKSHQESPEIEAGRRLKSRGKTVATAESCTGGYIAHLLTSVAGSSDYFKGGVVAYSNRVKEQLLGVDPAAIRTEGAVSETVVRQMAEGARKRLDTDYAVSVSGIAGPSGGTPEKPVGTVWISVAGPERTIARKYLFSAVREQNIVCSARKALELLQEELE